MKPTLLAAAVISSALVLSGCAGTTVVHNQATANAVANVHDLKLMYPDPVVVRVTGYGAPANNARLNTTQKQLLAMRASKLDAYRSLAERVYGIRLQGNSTVENMASRSDVFRGYVDSIIRGAKVLEVNELRGGSYETVMELVLEPATRYCLDHFVTTTGIQAHPYCMRTSVHGEMPQQRGVIYDPAVATPMGSSTVISPATVTGRTSGHYAVE